MRGHPYFKKHAPVITGDTLLLNRLNSVTIHGVLFLVCLTHESVKFEIKLSWPPENSKLSYKRDLFYIKITVSLFKFNNGLIRETPKNKIVLLDRH